MMRTNEAAEKASADASVEELTVFLVYIVFYMAV